MKLLHVTRTSIACPSQWEGVLDNGCMLYVRYRHGGLSINKSKEPTDDIYEAVNGEELLYEVVGEDGLMWWKELLPYLVKAGVDAEHLQFEEPYRNAIQEIFGNF